MDTSAKKIRLLKEVCLKGSKQIFFPNLEKKWSCYVRVGQLASPHNHWIKQMAEEIRERQIMCEWVKKIWKKSEKPTKKIPVNHHCFNNVKLQVLSKVWAAEQIFWKWMIEWMNEWLNANMNKWTNEKMNEWNASFDSSIIKETADQTHLCKSVKNTKMNEWMYECMNEWTNGQTNEWMNEWMNKRTDDWVND